MATQPSITHDSYSGTAFPVRISLGNKLLSHASAFFWEIEGSLFLVTNWHVVTGRSPETLRHLDQESFVEPDSLSYQLYTHEGETKDCRIPLYVEGVPVWMVHPTWRRAVDVVAIPVTDERPKFIMRPINRLPEKPLATRVGMDLFILGFPLEPARYPIWKRASIASEPDRALVEPRYMLIDSLSGPGMSGAPVIQRVSGVALLEYEPVGQSEEPEIAWEMQHFPATKFIGVYSGRRRTESPVDAQLGLVWRRHLLEGIVAAQKVDVPVEEQRPEDLPASKHGTHHTFLPPSQD